MICANTSALLAHENENLKIRIQESKEWIPVLPVEKFRKDEQKIDWRPLKKKSLELGKQIKKVICPRFGEVNSYHIDVWKEVYPNFIDMYVTSRDEEQDNE